MKKAFRVFLWIAAGLGALALIVAVTVVWFVRRPFPDVRGAVTLPGLEAPVEVLRDDRGVPHIWAETRGDMYFAQGYVHAQDRFWQMEFSRRVGAGTLSEALGADIVPTDRYLRTMGFYRVAEEEYRRMVEPYRSYLEAYAEGVNAYIRDREPAQLGMEFALLGLTGTDVPVEPWTPVHSLTWGKVMSETLSAGFRSELGNIAYRRFGGSALHDAFRPPFREDFPYIVSLEEVAAFRESQGLDPLSRALNAPARTLTPGGNGIGSNNWVIGGSRTAGGKPILANDMHLGVQMPSIWYEVGLHVSPDRDTWGHADDTPRTNGRELHLRGYTFPGVPAVIAGQNGRIAWGMTNLPGDAKDGHFVRVHPDDIDRYLVDGEWRDMEVVHEMIPIAGEDEPAEHTIRRTIYGPIVSDLADFERWFTYEISADGDGAPDEGSVAIYEIALRWSALTPENLLTAVIDVNEAQDYGDFRDALRNWGSPGQNLVYADVEGNIAYQATGRFPERPLDRGRLPAPAGEVPREPVPFEDLPAALNPAKDYIVTANQPVVPPSYPYALGDEGFAGGRRAARIAELIESLDAPADVGAMQSIHADVYSHGGAELTPHLLDLTPEEAIAAWQEYRASRRVSRADGGDGDGGNGDGGNGDGGNGDEGGGDEGGGGSAPDEAAAERRERAEAVVPAALDHLAEWNFEMAVESAGAAVYAFVLDALTAHLLRDDIPPYEWPMVWPGTAQSVIYQLLREPDHPIWDDRITPEREEPRTILARALVTGALELADAQGEDPEEWSWGAAHTITFENQSLGQSGIGIVERLVNRGPYPVPGGPTTVNVSGWRADEPFVVSHIASQRAVYDLADPAKSVFVHSTGQSGHPFHRNYIDMIESWSAVEYHDANWTYLEAREAAGRRRLLLEPGE